MSCFVSKEHHYIILKQVVHGQYFEKYYLKSKGQRHRYVGGMDAAGLGS